MAKFIKTMMATLLLTVGFGLTGVVQAANVEVVFSGRLTQNMDNLNGIEQEREKYFRETADDVASNRGKSNQYFNLSRHANVSWAGEALVPDLNDFTVEFFFKQMASEALKRAGKEDLEGTVRFTVKTLKVANHSLNFLRSTDSYVVGTIEHIGANGGILKSENISANLVYGVSVDNNYKGNDFAFFSTDLANRVGPTLSRFIQKALEELFEGEEFNGPIIIS